MKQLTGQVQPGHKVHMRYLTYLTMLAESRSRPASALQQIYKQHPIKTLGNSTIPPSQPSNQPFHSNSSADLPPWARPVLSSHIGNLPPLHISVLIGEEQERKGPDVHGAEHNGHIDI